MNQQPSGLQRSDLNVAFDDESLSSESHLESNDEDDESVNDLATNRNNNGDDDTDVVDCCVSIVNINKIRHDLIKASEVTCSGESCLKKNYGISKRPSLRQGSDDDREYPRYQAGSDGGDVSPAIRPGRRTSGDVMGDLYRSAGWMDFDDRKTLVQHGGRRLPPILDSDRCYKSGKNIANNANVLDEADKIRNEHYMARNQRNKTNNKPDNTKSPHKTKSKSTKSSKVNLSSVPSDLAVTNATNARHDRTKSHAAVLGYMPTYRLEPDPNLMFKHYRVKRMVSHVVEKELHNFTYSGEGASKKILLLCNAILAGVKMYPNKRYKIVVHVTFMEMAGQSCMVADRALGSKESDHVAVVQHVTDDMACIVTVHGVYMD